jgi:hypothetical protein
MKSLISICVLCMLASLLRAEGVPQHGFEENKGQVKTLQWNPRPDVLFAGNTQGMVFHLRNNGISFQLSGNVNLGDSNTVTELYRVDIDWLNANKDFEVETGCMLYGYCNYYNVPVGSEPALFVRQYASVTIKNLWQGIDLHYYFNEQGILESDWLVEPGADYRQIRMEIKGTEPFVTEDGYLVMQTPLGEIREGRLKVYQNSKLLDANWKLEGGIAGFEVFGHDPHLALRIDPPVLLWSTYYGGNEAEQGSSIAYSKNGLIAIAGHSMSFTQIATDSAHKSVLEDSVYKPNDAFLALFDSSGKRVWATYYGGIEQDGGSSCFF